MKNLTVAIICLFCLATSVFAGSNDDTFYKAGKVEAAQKQGFVLKGGEIKFNAVDDAGTTFTVVPGDVAVKLWFTDVAGNPYNPTKHRFNQRERFDIWICANAPVIVALFQNYQDDMKPSRLVYPVKGNPVTYKALQAFVPVKIPVSFEMDANMTDEIMSIVVSKGGKEVIEQAALDIDPAGPGVVNPVTPTPCIVPGSLDEEIIEPMFRFNGFARRNRRNPYRFNICSGSSLYVTSTTGGETTTTVQEYNKDVCCILFGHGNVAQYQITLHK